MSKWYARKQYKTLQQFDSPPKSNNIATIHSEVIESNAVHDDVFDGETEEGAYGRDSPVHVDACAAEAVRDALLESKPVHYAAGIFDGETEEGRDSPVHVDTCERCCAAEAVRDALLESKPVHYAAGTFDGETEEGRDSPVHVDACERCCADTEAVRDALLESKPVHDAASANVRDALLSLVAKTKVAAHGEQSLGKPSLFKEDVELAMPIAAFRDWMDPYGEASSTRFHFFVFSDENAVSSKGYEYGIPRSRLTRETAPDHRRNLYRYGLSDAEEASSVSVSSLRLQTQTRAPGAPVFFHGQFASMCNYDNVGEDNTRAWHRCNRYAIEVARTWWKLFDDMRPSAQNQVFEMSRSETDPMILSVTELGLKGALYAGELAVSDSPKLARCMTWPLIMPSASREWDEWSSDVSAHNKQAYSALHALFSEDVAADYDDLWKGATPAGLVALVKSPSDDPEEAKWQAWQVATKVFSNLAKAMPFWASAHLHMGLVNDPDIGEDERASASWGTHGSLKPSWSPVHSLCVPLDSLWRAGVPDVVWNPYASEAERIEVDAHGESTWAHEQLHRCVLGFYASDGVPAYDCHGDGVVPGDASASQCYRKWYVDNCK